MTMTTELLAVTAPQPAASRFAAASQMLHSMARSLLARASLQRLTDRQLADAGLIRHDIDCVRRFPLSADVSTQLSIRAGMRAGNW